MWIFHCPYPGSPCPASPFPTLPSALHRSFSTRAEPESHRDLPSRDSGRETHHVQRWGEMLLSWSPADGCYWESCSTWFLSRPRWLSLFVLTQPFLTSTEASHPIWELPTFLAFLNPPFPGNFPCRQLGCARNARYSQKPTERFCWVGDGAVGARGGGAGAEWALGLFESRCWMRICLPRGAAPVPQPPAEPSDGGCLSFCRYWPSR